MATANDFFNDSLQRFAPSPNVDGERWNLYNGLCCLSQDIETIRRDTEACKRLLLALNERLSH
jgi:hypothetical protein